MTITISDVDVDNEIARLALATGQTPDELVTQALRDSLAVRRAKLRQPVSREAAAEMMRQIREIQQHVASLPVLDARTPDGILGYNEHGVWE